MNDKNTEHTPFNPHAFLQTYPPDANNTKADSTTLTAYESRLPECVLTLWKLGGFGNYGNGLIKIINPSHYEQTLWGWLMREEDDPSRTPIALSSFGLMFYHRMLSDEGDEDISFIDPHTSENGVTTWSTQEFFESFILDPINREGLLDQTLFTQAMQQIGPLKHSDIYYFAPALRLGGRKSKEHLSHGDANVHLELLLQLALGT